MTLLCTRNFRLGIRLTISRVFSSLHVVMPLSTDLEHLDVLAVQVDSLYFPSFGRRKSWLVPAQLLCGGMMLWARSVMDDWIGEDGGEPHVKTLTAYFLALYFIMATQVCLIKLQRPILAALANQTYLIFLGFTLFSLR